MKKSNYSDNSPSRNSFCPCGSGKKFKRCCIDKEPEISSPPSNGILSLYDPLSGYNSFEDEDDFLVEIFPEADEQINQVLQLLDKKQFKEAESILKQLLKHYSHYAPVLFAKGVFHGVQDETEEAINYFEQAVELQPDFIEAWHNLGQAYNNNHDILGAIHSAKAVVEHAGNHPLDKELAEQNSEYLANAAKTVKKSQGISLDEFIFCLENFQLGLFKIQHDCIESAIESFELVLKKNPKSHQSHGNIALCYAKLGNKAKAMLHVEKSLKIDPTYEVAKGNKSMIQAMIEGQPLDKPTEIVHYLY